VLVEAARLEGAARAVVADLDEVAAAALLTAWRTAVAQQDAEVDAAIEGSLALVPRLLRRRVLAVLTRGRT
jgi:hypothetical protein